MQLNTKLQQTQTQKQTLSMQQQYALRILAMSDTQLQKEIEQMVEENPLLEYRDVYLASNDAFEHASQIIGTKETLKDVLSLQLHTREADISYELGEYLIESIDGNGYLSVDVLPFDTIDEDTFEDTLAFLQTFEPYGVFARDLQECLLIQLCHHDSPFAHVAIQIVNDFMNELAQHKYSKIADALQINLEQVQEALALILSLDPKPGSRYASDALPVTSDAQISVIQEHIHIQMRASSEFLRINTTYQNIKDDVAQAYIQKATKQAQVFLNCLDKRNATLSAILTCICEIQHDYFVYGKDLKPLTLARISKEINFHESTISRAISQKFISFEGRYCPIKSFFPSRLDGGQSSSQIHSKIKELIAQEPSHKPYSDQQISKMLEQDNIKVSRRTIAKYRDQMKIMPASLRKSE